MGNKIAHTMFITLIAAVGLLSAGSVLAQEKGILKVCKVAGPGVALGTPFTFHAGSSVFTVLAGAAPGGNCVVVSPSFPVGLPVTVVESIPSGDTVTGITVAPASGLLGSPNLPAGTVNVLIGHGFTEVTYTNKRTGFLEICKKGHVGGSFTFYVNPGALGPFAVFANGCSPAIEVPAGPVIINEVPTFGSTMIGCDTIPPSQQGACNLSTLSSTVTVTAGDISHQTVANITNRPNPIDPTGDLPDTSDLQP